MQRRKQRVSGTARRGESTVAQAASAIRPGEKCDRVPWTGRFRAAPGTCFPWRPLALLACAFCYLWLVVDPRLIYHCGWQQFYTERTFLYNALHRYGGVVEYVGAFAVQLNQIAVAGALSATVLTALLVFGASRILGKGSMWRRSLAWLPGLLILIMEGRYAGHVIEVGLGVLVAMVGVLGWLGWRGRKGWIGYAIFWLIAGTAFYIGGAVSGSLFVVSGGIIELRLTRSFGSALGCWAALLLFPATHAVFSGPQPAEMVGVLGRGVFLGAAVLLLLYLPLACLLGRVDVDAARLLPARRSLPASDTEGGLERQQFTGMTWADFIVVLATSAALLLCTFDRRTCALARIERAAQEREWESVLHTARRGGIKPLPTARLAITLALFHTGRLNDELFAYPQQKGAELLPSIRESLDMCSLLADALLELGQINLAEHFAHEALELRGERPHILWQLARINVLKDRPRAARVFLNKLSRIPFQRERALRRIAALEADPALSSESDISNVRALRVTSDIAESGVPTEVVLRQCLSSNPRNRMAFEFFLAQCLLDARFDQLLKNAGSLASFGIWETPRHIEEAMLFHAAATGSKDAPLGDRRPRAESVRRFRVFQETLARNGGRTDGIERVLLRDFGDTFWFYHLFGRTLGPTRPAFAQLRP